MRKITGRFMRFVLLACVIAGLTTTTGCKFTIDSGAGGEIKQPWPLPSGGGNVRIGGTYSSANMQVVPGGQLSVTVVPSSPLPVTSENCAGHYALCVNGKMVDVDLKRDGTFTTRNAKGVWSVRDGKLTAHVTRVWAIVCWKSHSVTVFDNAPITKLTASEATINGVTVSRSS
jgi:hypothetical protein